MNIDPVSTTIGLMALVASVWSILATRHIGKTQNALQERLVNLETAREVDRLAHARRAQLRARILRGAESSYHLVITNEGLAEARAVTVGIDGKPLGEHERLPIRESGLVQTLGAGAEARYRISITMGTPSIFDVVLRWEDDTGEPGFWRSQLRWQ